HAPQWTLRLADAPSDSPAHAPKPKPNDGIGSRGRSVWFCRRRRVSALAVVSSSFRAPFGERPNAFHVVNSGSMARKFAMQLARRSAQPSLGSDRAAQKTRTTSVFTSGMSPLDERLLTEQPGDAVPRQRVVQDDDDAEYGRRAWCIGVDERRHGSG